MYNKNAIPITVPTKTAVPKIANATVFPVSTCRTFTQIISSDEISIASPEIVCLITAFLDRSYLAGLFGGNSITSPDFVTTVTISPVGCSQNSWTGNSRALWQLDNKFSNATDVIIDISRLIE